MIDMNVKLEQLRVLIAIADTGSFSAAARQLQRTQGAISYNIATLEQELELVLFDRAGRRPIFTESGLAILSESRSVLERVAHLGEVAKGLRDGLESKVSVIVDMLFPTSRLVEVIRDFESAFPTVQLDVRTGVLASVTTDVENGACALGVTGVVDLPQSLIGGRCCTVKLIPAASPTHPLSSADTPISMGTLRQYTNIVMPDVAGDAATKPYVFGRRIWRVSDSEVRLALVRSGLGWGRFSEYQIADDLASGRLVYLATLKWSTPKVVELRTIFHAERPLGPAGSWLRERLAHTHASKSSVASPHPSPSE